MFYRDRPSYPRRQWLAARNRFLRANAAALAGVTLFVLVLVLAEGLFIHGYVLGLVQGAAFSAFVCMILLVSIGATGSMNQLAGAWGEDNTRDLLRAAKRHGLIWGWVDGLEVQGGDVDHLVVTRDGGVVAIDSKWRSVALTPEVLAEDVQRAKTARRRASLILRSCKSTPEVRPLLVYWGGIRTEVENQPDRVLEGTEFLAGRELTAWLRRQHGRPVSRADARRVMKELRAFKRRVQPEALGSASPQVAAAP